MRGKAVRIVIGALSVLLVCVGGYWFNSKWKKTEKIPPAEKVVLSDQILPKSRVQPPSLELWASVTSVWDVYVVEGVIIEQKMVWGETVSTLDLDRVWYGDIVESEKTIPIWMTGKKNSMMTMPDVGDHVVLFVFKQDVYTKKDQYWSLDMDHSIFTITNGRLYAFSNEEGLSKYDGERVSALIHDFYEELDKQNRE